MNKVDKSKCILVMCEEPYSIDHIWFDTKGSVFLPEHARKLYDMLNLYRVVVIMFDGSRKYTVGENFVEAPGGITYVGPNLERVK